MKDVKLRTSLKMADMDLDLVLGSGECVLTVTDTVTEEMVTFPISPEQAGAIWYLAIAVALSGDKLVKRLYKLVEPAIEGLARRRMSRSRTTTVAASSVSGSCAHCFPSAGVKLKSAGTEPFCTKIRCSSVS